jgi:hypothetical protein
MQPSDQRSQRVVGRYDPEPAGPLTPERLLRSVAPGLSVFAALIVAVAVGLTAVRHWRGITLSFEYAVLETPVVPDRLGIEFYYSTGAEEGFSEKRVIRLPLRDAPAGAFVRYEVTLPAGARQVRFDPLPRAGTVAMRDLHVHHYGDEAVDFEGHAEVRPLDGIGELTVRGGELVLRAVDEQPRIMLFEDLSRFGRFTRRWLRDVILAAALLLPLALWLVHSGWAAALASAFGRARWAAGEALLRRSAVDPVLYAGLLALLVLGGGGFLGRVHSPGSGGWWAALAAVTLQVGVVLCVGFATITLLARTRPRLQIALYALGLFAACFQLVELGTRSLLGFGAVAGLRQAFAFGLGAGWRTIRYTGVPAAELALYGAALTLLVTGCVAAARASVRAASTARWRLSPAGALAIAVAQLVLVAAEQRLAARWRDPVAWEREQAEVPLYLPLVRAPRPGVTVPVAIRPFVRKDRAPENLPAPAPSAPDVDVFLFVVESLRADAIHPEVAPNFHRFASENVSFEHAYASANNTCFAWYPILNSDYPIYYPDYWRVVDPQGSPAMAMLKRAGFTLSVFASDDLSFCAYREAVFGRGSRLLDYMLPVTGYDYAANDRRTMSALDAHLRRSAGGRNLYAVFLDATHNAYTWPADFVPRFVPFVPEYGVTAAAFDPAKHEHIRNRYRNAVHYIDTLFGAFVQTLKDTGRWERAIVAVVGDHGEEFGEHGAFLHGRSLLNPQMRIALAYRLPALGRSRLALGSQLDVMPTLLDAAGVPDQAGLLEGRSLLRPAPRHEYALSTSSGGVAVPYEFVLAGAERKLFFELDQQDPVRSRELLVREVRDADDRPVVPEEAGSRGLVRLVETHFRRHLEDVGFIAWLGEAGAPVSARLGQHENTGR